MGLAGFASLSVMGDAKKSGGRLSPVHRRLWIRRFDGYRCAAFRIRCLPLADTRNRLLLALPFWGVS